MKKKIFLSVFILLALCNIPTFATLPESREATIIDASNSSEVVLEATGIFFSQKTLCKKSDVQKNGIFNASKDARKAAIYYLLYSGTDPILSSSKEQDAFDAIQSDFFSDENIKKFITYEDALPQKKVTLKEGIGIKVILNIKVNRDALTKSLEDYKIIASHDALQESQGNPTIMVIPQTKKGESPIDVLGSNDEAKVAGSVIESYLTSKKYEVILPNQQSFLQDLQKAHASLSGQKEDLAYQLALSVGSDIYIDYSVEESDAAFDTQKYAVTVRAYETTTARLLGSETGHSKARKGEKFVSIEEAMQEALYNVLNRVNNYWKDDTANGTQYKVIFQIKPDSFTPKQNQDIQDSIFQTVESVGKKSKENITTEQTMDFVLWFGTNQPNQTRKLWYKIRDSFNGTSPVAELSVINQNRKLLVIGVDPKKK